MRPNPLLLVLFAAALLLGGTWLVTSGRGGALVPEVLATDASGDGVLGPGDRPTGDGAGVVGGGRESIEIPAARPTPDELAAAGEGDPHSRVTGRVLGAGGAPLEGAEVVARVASRWMPLPADVEEVPVWGRGERAFTATTDEEGRFFLDDLEPNDYGFSVRADGYAPHERRSERIPEHERYDLGDFELSRGIVVEGTVTDRRGRPIAGARVLRAVSDAGGSARLELPGFGVPLATTDAEGRFRAAILRPGSWHLLFDAPSFRVAERTGETAPAGSRETGLDVVLDRGLAIEGRVDGLVPDPKRPLRVTARFAKDQPSGDASGAEGIERQRSRSGAVAADGSFHIGGLAPRTRYRLTLEQRAKPDEESDVPLEELPWRDARGVSSVDAMAGDERVVLEYVELSVLRFTAVDADSGEAVTNFVALVEGRGLGGDGLLEDEDGEPRYAHSGGRAAFEELRAQSGGSEATLVVRAPGYRDLRREGLLIAPGVELDLGALELRPAPRVPVRVVDAKTGDPLTDARVFLAGPEAADELQDHVDSPHDRVPRTRNELVCERTDDDGRALLTALPGKLCRVRASCIGYSPSEAESSTPPHEVPIELALERAATVTVHVVDDAGEPARGFHVRRSRSDGESSDRGNRRGGGEEARTSTDETGTIVFADVTPGRWSFWVAGPDERNRGWMRYGQEAPPEGAEQVDVASGEEVVVELVVEPRGGALLRVTEGGEACEGALIQLERLDPDNDGRRYWWGGGMDDPLRGLTDHEGRAEFEGLELGRYRATISHPRRSMASGLELDVVRDPDEIRFELGVTAIEGVVVDPNGRPLPGVRIEVGSADGDDLWVYDYRVRVELDQDGDPEFGWESVDREALTTDRDGRYRLEGVRNGVRLVVGARHEFVVAGSRTIDALMRDEVRVGVDFVLERAGVLLVDTSQVPGSGRERRMMRATRTAGEGEPEVQLAHVRRGRTWPFGSLRPGAWRIEWLSEDGSTTLAAGEAEVVAEERRTVVLTP